MNPFEVTKLIKKMDETKPLVHGSVMGNNPVIRDHRSKYADFKWNKERYPTYVSGGGFIMNFAAAMAIQSQIPTTPLIAIDDAYIGKSSDDSNPQSQKREDSKYRCEIYV